MTVVAAAAAAAAVTTATTDVEREGAVKIKVWWRGSGGSGCGSERLARAAICWCFFAQGIVLGNWAGIIPSIKHMHHLQNGRLGLLLAGTVGGALSSLPLIGFLTKTVGSKTASAFGLIALAGFFQLVGIDGPIWLLALAFVLVGFALAVADISISYQAILFEKLYSPSMSTFYAFFSFGSASGAIIGGITQQLGKTPMFDVVVIAIIMTVPSLISFDFLIDKQTEIRLNSIVQGSMSSANLLEPETPADTSTTTTTIRSQRSQPSPMIELSQTQSQGQSHGHSHGHHHDKGDAYSQVPMQLPADSEFDLAIVLIDSHQPTVHEEPLGSELDLESGKSQHKKPAKSIEQSKPTADCITLSIAIGEEDLALTSFVEEDVYLDDDDDGQDDKDKKATGMDGGSSSNSNDDTSSGAEGTDTDSSIKRYRAVCMLYLTCVKGLINIVEGSVGDWSAIFLRENLNASPLVCTFGYFAYHTAFIITRFFTNGITARFAYWNVLQLFCTVAFLGLTLVSFSPFSSIPIPLSIVGYCLCGSGLSIVSPLVISTAGRLDHGKSDNNSVMLVTSVSYIGYLIGPPLVGGLSQFLGLQYSFLTVAGLISLIPWVSIAQGRFVLARKPPQFSI